MEQKATNNTPRQITKAEAGAAFSKPQLWLLLGVLAIGVVWDVSLETGHYYWISIFWLTALAVFTVFNFRHIRHNATAIAVGIPAVAACVVFMFDYLNFELVGWTFVAIPAILVTFAVFVTQDIPVKREGAAVVGVLRAVFVKPFTGVPTFFRAIRSLFRGEQRSSARRVAIGLAIGLPLAVIVLALLSSADDQMHALMGGLFADFDVGKWFVRVIVVTIAAMLFYSVFYNLTWGKKDRALKPVLRSWGLAAPAVVIGMLLLSYALFTYSQFAYLFGGKLPIDTTYSSYAREGFAQFLAVALINFAVFGVCLSKTERSRGIRVLEGLLLFASLLILASAAWRMLLYIGAYGLTIKRILPLWLMAYLLYLTVAAAVRIYREKTPLVRISAFALLYWYVALICIDWNTIIYSYNLTHGFGG
jgi:hypothetical protein